MKPTLLSPTMISRRLTIPATGSGKTILPNTESDLNLPANIGIVGVSDSGIENLAVSLIHEVGHFDRVFLILDHPEEYQDLIRIYKDVGQQFGKELITVLTDYDDLPSIDEFNCRDRNLVFCEKPIMEKDFKKMFRFWAGGRPRNITMIILSHTVFCIPKWIRCNTNVLILRGRVQKRDLETLTTSNMTYIADKTPEELRDMIEKCNPGGTGLTDFFMIDSNTRDPRYMFRKGFTPIDENR